MFSLLLSTIIISVLHALIPSHWLPLLAISKQYHWANRRTLLVTLYMGIAHVLSTLLLGITLSTLGNNLYAKYRHLFTIAAPCSLILFGIIFIYRHYKHHHFYITKNNEPNASTLKIISSLVVVMFISPCLEVEGIFLVAGKYGYIQVAYIALIYATLSIIGMLAWMYAALHGLQKLDWHKIEHNAGLITGITLILTGLLTYYIK